MPQPKHGRGQTPPQKKKFFQSPLKQMAEKSDLAPKMISLIERFQRNPSLNVADSIAQGLSVPLWRLIKDTEDLRREKIAAKKRK